MHVNKTPFLNVLELMEEAVTMTRLAAAGLRIQADGQLSQITRDVSEATVVAGVFTVRVARRLAERDEIRISHELLNSARLVEKEHGKTADQYRERLSRR